MRSAALLLSLLLAASASADWCQWEDDPPSNYVFVCYPEYDTPMMQQPDYSLYSVGTIFWLHRDGSGNVDTWYATTSSGSAPSCCSEGPQILQDTGYLVPKNICSASRARFGDGSEIERLICYDTSSGSEATWAVTSCNRGVYCFGMSPCQAANSSALPCP